MAASLVHCGVYRTFNSEDAKISCLFAAWPEGAAIRFISLIFTRSLCKCLLVCREKTQLCILMELVRQSVTEPFQHIPALTAVYLAEASFALTQPGSALFPAISRHLLRRPALDLEVT